MRADGKRAKEVMPMYQIASFIMSKRSDAQNMLTVDIPLEPIKSYLNSKKKQGAALSHLGLFIAAYIRTMCEYPHLNRFVVNRRIYSRNEIAVGMVVLKAGDMSKETMSKIYFDIDDTVFDVERKINEYIEENRKLGDTNGTDGIINALLKIPFLCGFSVGLFKLMDRYGLLPKAVIDMSPFHESLLISNLASIRANHIYHHAYDFGTTSVAMTMGAFRYVSKLKDGVASAEKCIPLGVVMDERIATGVYFSKAFRRFRDLLADPRLLEQPPEKVLLDCENQYFKQKLRRERLKLKKLKKIKARQSKQEITML